MNSSLWWRAMGRRWRQAVQLPVLSLRLASLVGISNERLGSAIRPTLARALLRSPSEILTAFAKNQSGATMILVALCMPIMVGAMGLSAEVSYWYLRQRAMQNAADAAVIAAATNGGSSYAAEAKAVAAQYGF